jgi:hypothetical protein
MTPVERSSKLTPGCAIEAIGDTSITIAVVRYIGCSLCRARVTVDTDGVIHSTKTCNVIETMPLFQEP